VPLAALPFSRQTPCNSGIRTGSRATFLAAVLAFCFLVASCNSGTNESAIHGITRELAAKARKATPAGTVIRMKLQAATSKEPELPDWLEITLFTQASAADSAAQAGQLLNEFSKIAERHKLQSGKRYDREASLSISFQSGSRTTHYIEVRFVPGAETVQKGNAVTSLPRLAIILDDLGSDRAAAESIFAMRYPLTISVLPNHEHSREIAEEALERGYQVMLHLPMQSVAGESPEKEELRRGMSRAAVVKLLDEMVASVPNAVGVNNHQGSQATSDPLLMEDLMPALRELNLFYVDSRTTAATVAFDTAKKDGVPAAFRNVPFLDDVQDVAAIRKQLEFALRSVKEKKSAIAIGHPHRATVEALREFLPTVQAKGVQLVFASELVR
jgi:polysaccharide deacetylase 2 family uncharacterized protein YibQ